MAPTSTPDAEKYARLCRSLIDGFAWRCSRALKAFPADPETKHTLIWLRGLEDELVSRSLS